jgi:rSAM/selenodomain-associated transferase 2
MNLSVVIPTWNEASNLSAALEALGRAADVVVADGGSADRTKEIAQQAGARVVCCERGRAHQMNRGAEAAEGDALLFLHADAILGAGWHEALVGALRDRSVVGGSFQLRIRSPRRLLALVARGSNLRARYLGMPYGDQGIFVRRTAFRTVGGFPEVPFLEDVVLIRKLRRLGSLRQLDVAVTTGSRHWEDLGVLRTTLLNWAMVVAYFSGVSPGTLEPYYRRLRRGEKRHSRSEEAMAHPD